MLASEKVAVEFDSRRLQERSIYGQNRCSHAVRGAARTVTRCISTFPAQRLVKKKERAVDTQRVFPGDDRMQMITGVALLGTWSCLLYQKIQAFLRITGVNEMSTNAKQRRTQAIVYCTCRIY